MYKLADAEINTILDEQVNAAVKSMFMRSRDKKQFGKYTTMPGKVKDSVTEDDVARILWPTVGGNPPANFIARIKERLEASPKIKKKPFNITRLGRGRPNGI